MTPAAPPIPGEPPTDGGPPPPRVRGLWKSCWSIDGREVHVRPRNDHIWHPLTDDCVCGPSTEPIYPDDDSAEILAWLVTHQALDGREALQWPAE
jgi:hypothetical protein